jgi:diguanylate cyclase
MIKAINSWIRKKSDRHLGGHAVFFFWAIVVFALLGTVQLFQPVEDLVREVRNSVRSQPASGEYVFVGIDTKTLNELPNVKSDRSYDAQVIDNLFAAGARRVYYYDTHTTPGTPKGDEKFSSVFKKYDGRFFIGHRGPISNLSAKQIFFDQKKSIFDDGKNSVGLIQKYSPFLLSVDMPYLHISGETKTKSLSYHMSENKNNEHNGELFRPDFSISSSSIKSYNYLDVYKSLNLNKIKGKTIVIGSNEPFSRDMFYLPSQGYIPSAHLHIIAAETLKKGQPRDFGWLVLFLISTAFSAMIFFVKSNRNFVILSLGALTAFILGPLVSDALLVKIEILPSLVLTLCVSVRSFITRYAELSAQTNRVTGIKNFAALQDGPAYRQHTIIAIKVRNFAAIAGRFDRNVEADIYNEISRRIALMTPDPELYQSSDTLVWVTEMAPNADLFNSLSGINTLTQASSFVIDDIKVEVSLAFGIEGDNSRHVELRLIDALANAETAARSNRLYNVATDETRDYESRKLDLLASFDQALNNGEIWAAYQPKFNAKTGQFKSAEALARWSNDRFGTISAGEFITLAESNNRITELTWSMLDHVINTLKQMKLTAPDFNVSINISPRLILDPNFETTILDKLNASAIAPEHLTLEIIETEKLDIELAEPVLRSLAKKGIRLSVDDYGTGQATLDYLRADTFQEIKIDRKFVSRMDVSKSDHEMVLATIQMAHSLGKTVVAEGIEHAHIGRMLTQMGCDEVQGFHYAMPMTCDELMAMAEHQNRDLKRMNIG